ASLKSQAPDAPAELQRIVKKALRKDRDQRYQHVKDLLLDLKDLKQELEFEAKLKGTQQFVVQPSGGVAPQPPVGGISSAQSAEIATNEMMAARATSSAEIILGEIKRHKTGVMIALAALVVVVIGSLFGLFKLVIQQSSDQAADQMTKPAAGQNMKIQRLTANGKVENAAISPDGKYLVYVMNDGGRQSLWYRLIATNSNVQIVPPADVSYGGQTFSPDGTYIYYFTFDKN